MEKSNGALKLNIVMQILNKITFQKFLENNEM